MLCAFQLNYGDEDWIHVKSDGRVISGCYRPAETVFVFKLHDRPFAEIISGCVSLLDLPFMIPLFRAISRKLCHFSDLASKLCIIVAVLKRISRRGESGGKGQPWQQAYI